MFSQRTLQAVFSVAIILIGAHMLYQFAWPTAPAISGLAFLLIGFSLWMPHCPICRRICKK